MSEYICIYGARGEHNLKNIELYIPRNQLVVITGLSGSSKSSLTFDTIYADGQPHYLETLLAYARKFLGGLERPNVDKIEGLSPVIAIEQKNRFKKSAFHFRDYYRSLRFFKTSLRAHSRCLFLHYGRKNGRIY